MAMSGALAARIMRSKSSQALSLLPHAKQDASSASALASPLMQKTTNTSGSSSEKTGGLEAREDRFSSSANSKAGASSVFRSTGALGVNSRSMHFAGGGKRSMYTDVAAARVGRRPSRIPENEMDAFQGLQEMAAGSGATAKMSIVLKSFEKIRPGRLNNVNKVGLPTTRILFTFNRSPHVDKKSREQFEMKTRKKLLVMDMDVAKLREKYNMLKNHNMLGVQLKVNFHYKTRLDMSRLKEPVEETTAVPQLGEDQNEQTEAKQ